MYTISLSSSEPVPVVLSTFASSSSSIGASSPVLSVTCRRKEAISGASNGIGSGRSSIVNVESDEKIAFSDEGRSWVVCNGSGTTALNASYS
jgi:hypothetical protein